MSKIARLKQISRLVCVIALLAPGTLLADNLTELWSIKNTFVMPESAAFDGERQQIFVSNVNGYAKDDNGFVSRISADGEEVELRWLTGLHSPTGMAVHDGLLYIADFDALVIADIEQRKVRNRIPAPDARPVLNDVAISSDGQVFVSGSASRSIYFLEGDRLLVWKHDKQRLEGANGLLVQDQQLVHGGLLWSVFDLQTKELVSGFKKPDARIVDVDGITTIGCGIYIVTLIDDPRLWRVNADGSSQPLSELAIDGIDIQYHMGKLYVPTVGGGLSVFRLADHSCGPESD
ncbi:MAG: hypothetical protein HKN85_10895 [Gammaproteobacteria bacterium]|nr:hypothetical protein [Gammaproteobacteria bacterium]